ncbi:hypothetical protein C8R43DRAFT_491033 [Mycena crocata]|nr:hypothetical protein C8R43DRAFT_491033 [Mycena crocata]
MTQAIYDLTPRRDPCATDHISATATIEASTMLEGSPILWQRFAPIFCLEAEKEWGTPAAVPYSLSTATRGMQNNPSNKKTIESNALIQWATHQLGGSWPACDAMPADDRKEKPRNSSIQTNALRQWITQQFGGSWPARDPMPADDRKEKPGTLNELHFFGGASGTDSSTTDVDLSMEVLSPQARDGLIALSQNKPRVDSDVVLGILNAQQVPEIWTSRESAVLTPIEEAPAWDTLLSAGAKNGLTAAAQGMAPFRNSDDLLAILNAEDGDSDEGNFAAGSWVFGEFGSFEAASEELYGSKFEQNWKASSLADHACPQFTEFFQYVGSSSSSDEVLAAFNGQHGYFGVPQEQIDNGDLEAYVSMGIHMHSPSGGRVTFDDVPAQSNVFSEAGSNDGSYTDGSDATDYLGTNLSVLRRSPATSMTSAWVSTSYRNAMEGQQRKAPAWVVSRSAFEERLGFFGTWPMPKDAGEESEEEPWN